MAVLRISWGPQHPASGQMRIILDVDGDIVVNASPSVGYTHRSIEKLAEYRRYFQIVPLVERICNLDSFNVTLGYVQAVEELMGIVPPERAQFIRVIMSELNRITSHLYWLALFGIMPGQPTMLMWPIADRELFLDLAEMVTGSRVTYSYFTIGGVRADLPSDLSNRALKTLDYFEKRLKVYDKMLYRSKLYEMRNRDVGVMRKADAINLGVVGPNLRGSGVKVDTRKDEPYQVYDRFEFEVPTEEAGDAEARAKVRFHEMEQSINIVRQALDKLPEGPFQVKAPFRAPPGEVYKKVEAARGELGFYIVSDGTDKPYRLKISSPSFRNLAAFPFLMRDVTMADIPVIYFSLDPFPLDIDR